MRALYDQLPETLNKPGSIEQDPKYRARISTPEDFDSKLIGWLKDAYALAE